MMFYCEQCDRLLDGDYVEAEDYEGEIICQECFDKLDPTPWCHACGSMTKAGCDCGPIAENN